MDRAGWDLVVVGGVDTDYLVCGPRLPTPGQTVQGDVFLEGPGGKGANQAVAAARLGARVALVARLGRDARGAAVLAHLSEEGVDTRHVTYDAEAVTGAALVHVDERGRKQILAALGANRRLTTADVRAAEAIRAARVLLAPLEVPLDSVWAALRIARAAGARTVLDPAPPAHLPDELLRLVDVIKPNRHEAEYLTGVDPRDRASALAVARRLLERGVGGVAVQVGDTGNLIVTHEGERWLPHLPVRAVDSTGAGDAFAAGLAVGMAEGRSALEAGPLASAAAALATTALGAQTGLPRRADVQALLAAAMER